VALGIPNIDTQQEESGVRGRERDRERERERERERGEGMRLNHLSIERAVDVISLENELDSYGNR